MASESENLTRAKAWTVVMFQMLDKAMKKHAPMNSPHEAYAVILEELDEFWDEVKKQNGGRTPEAVKEALQTAAMCIRFVVDIVPPDQDEFIMRFLNG